MHPPLYLTLDSLIFLFLVSDDSLISMTGSLMDLDPFFSDDEGEEDTMGGNGSSSAGAEGGRDRGERGSSSGAPGATIWDSKAEYLKTKRLAEPYFPKSTTHMAYANASNGGAGAAGGAASASAASASSSGRVSVMTGSGSSEQQDEETTVASVSSSSNPSTINGSVPLPVSAPIRSRDVELHWAQAIAEACQVPDLAVRPGMPVPGTSLI